MDGRAQSQPARALSTTIRHPGTLRYRRLSGDGGVDLIEKRCEQRFVAAIADHALRVVARGRTFGEKLLPAIAIALLRNETLKGMRPGRHHHRAVAANEILCLSTSHGSSIGSGRVCRAHRQNARNEDQDRSRHPPHDETLSRWKTETISIADQGRNAVSGRAHSTDPKQNTPLADEAFRDFGSLSRGPLSLRLGYPPEFGKNFRRVFAKARRGTVHRHPGARIADGAAHGGDMIALR